jgi:translation elongation factor EF-Tu-like GTPase
MPLHERPPDVEAEISFVSTEQGGRQTPFSSGYRPQFHYGEEIWDAEHEYPDDDRVFPGETVRVLLRFARPEAHVHQIHKDMEFLIQEGARVVGRGRITKLLHIEETVRKIKKSSVTNI